MLASLVDSLVDLASQGVVAMTENQSKVGQQRVARDLGSSDGGKG